MVSDDTENISGNVANFDVILDFYEGFCNILYSWWFLKGQNIIDLI